MTELNPLFLLHQKRIKDQLSKKETLTFAVHDTCRFDNGGLLSVGSVKSEIHGRFVAFVPAAGAASRYFKPLEALRVALEQKSATAQIAACLKLRDEGAMQWPLPEALRKTIAATEATLTESERQEILSWLDAPKALLPHRLNQDDFLTVKFREHEALPSIVGQVYVTPEGRTKDFQKQWQAYQERALSKKTSAFMEQSDDMVTARFTKDGEAVKESDGQWSRVPAGHGTLTKLFPKIAAAFPDADALFVKNIDNVIPRNPKTEEAHERFFTAYSMTLDVVRQGRKAAKARDKSAMENAIKMFMVQWPQPSLPNAVIETDEEKRLATTSEAGLAFLQAIFHLTADTAKLYAKPDAWDFMGALWDRPFNMLGQVPNLGKDVGGTAVFVETSHGLQKLCMELPHFKDGDREHFLMDAKKATHFNPVFCAAELVTDTGAYENEDNPFWIIAAKSYKGQDVFYHETVLYELLGNSLFTNCLFVEVPRLVFNPHKSLQDGMSPLA